MEFFVARNFIFYDFKYRFIQRFGGCFLLVLFFFPIIKSNTRLKILLASHRASYGQFSSKLIKKNLQRISGVVRPLGVAPEKIKKEIIGRSIVLKRPLEQGGVVTEKGIMLIKFSETFTLYLKYVDCEKLTKNFHVVLEPSWTGHAIEQILGWCKFKEKVYIQCAGKPDFDFIASLQSNLIPLRMGSGEFVDYRVFQPITKNKKYDLVCVANGFVHKRVYAYLRLARELKNKNPDVRVALVCASRGPLMGAIDRLINMMGLRGSLDYLIDLSQEELNKIIEQSKINILMSYREGASRVIFEAIFSGTPSVILDRNIGIRKECFTKDSGMVAREAFLAQDIETLLRRTSSMNPRAWALQNISPEVSIKRLVELISAEEYGGADFQNPVYCKVNSPEATYMHFYPDLTKEASDLMLKYYLS